MRAWTLVLSLLLSASALADVIHLKNGGTISGTIVSETEEEIVVRTPSGKMTLPRRTVKEVKKQSRGETLLALAHERAKAGAYAEAERLYQQAAEDPDPVIAERARSALARFQRGQKRIKGYRQGPRTTWPLPSGVTGKPVEGETLQEQLDRARRALETENGVRALRLLQPLVESKPDDKVLRFLRGRAYEFLGREADAQTDYRTILSQRTPGWGERPAAWLGELARRKLGGEKLGLKSPGVPLSWRRVETAHFAAYRAGDLGWIAKELETAYQDALERFEIKKREVYIAGKIQVWVLRDVESWSAGEGLRLPDDARHAVRLAAPDGELRAILAYPDRGFFARRVRHEVAHAVVEDVHPGLPAWAAEGAACYLEPPLEREERYAAARRWRKRLDNPGQFLSGSVAPQETPSSQERWEAQAAIWFEVLAQRLGVRPALKLCQRIASTEDLGASLQRFKVDLLKLRKAFDRKVQEGE